MINYFLIWQGEVNVNLLIKYIIKSATRSRTIEMDDLKFHQCVDMNKFQSERIIEFTPPDGQFELMNYRLNTQVIFKYKIFS
jgi:AP-1 complex subunit mu